MTMFLRKEVLLILRCGRMGEKPYTGWDEVKNEMRKWRAINIGCIVIALLFVIAGAAAEGHDLVAVQNGVPLLMQS